MSDLKILIVCAGNICRSPMGHGLLQHKVKELGLHWLVDSAGTGGWHEGELPDARAIACMKRHHIDITYQHARQIIADDLQDFDLIYVMDKANLADVMDLTRSEEEQNKVSLIMSLVYEQTPIDVPDPYFGVGEKGFENVYQMLDEATDKIIEKFMV